MKYSEMIALAKAKPGEDVEVEIGTIAHFDPETKTTRVTLFGFHDSISGELVLIVPPISALFS